MVLVYIWGKKLIVELPCMQCHEKLFISLYNSLYIAVEMVKNCLKKIGTTTRAYKRKEGMQLGLN